MRQRLLSIATTGPEDMLLERVKIGVGTEQEDADGRTKPLIAKSRLMQAGTPRL